MSSTKQTFCCITSWATDDHSCFYTISARLLPLPLYLCQLSGLRTVYSWFRTLLQGCWPSPLGWLGFPSCSGSISRYWLLHIDPCMVRHLQTSMICSTHLAPVGHLGPLTRGSLYCPSHSTKNKRGWCFWSYGSIIVEPSSDTHKISSLWWRF